MALTTNKSLYLHVPKAGGLWIRHVYRVLGINTVEFGQQHSSFPELLKFNNQEFYQRLFTFTFIRHPLTWYQSRWAFRMKSGWRAQHPLDHNCMSNNFTTFVDNALKYKPSGWVTWEYKSFIDTVPYNINFIGKTEYLVDNLISALKMAGESVDEKVVRAIPRVNDSDLDGKPSHYWAKYTPELAERVMAVEHEVINRFYADYTVNPKTLFDSRYC